MVRGGVFFLFRIFAKIPSWTVETTGACDVGDIRKATSSLNAIAVLLMFYIIAVRQDKVK